MFLSACGQVQPPAAAPTTAPSTAVSPTAAPPAVRATAPPPAAPTTPPRSPAAQPERTPTAAPQERTPAPCADPCYGEPRLAGVFDAEAVPGASGLAASWRNPGVLYLLDDRPGTGEVWAVASDGAMLGAITVPGLDARDTESLAVGPCDAQASESCVYVGDIGDNLRSREAVTVHRFPEPDLADGVPEGVAADAARLSYPDGPHDAEALLVDDAGRVFIVTKAPFDPDTRATGEARLYRAAAFADGVLEDLGAVPVPEPDAPLHSLAVGNVVTGGDYRYGRVLLRTYDQVLEYRAPLPDPRSGPRSGPQVRGSPLPDPRSGPRSGPQVRGSPDTDLATLAEWEVRALPSPFEPQSEAITWAPGGCGYFTAGEMVGHLWYVPCEL